MPFAKTLAQYNDRLHTCWPSCKLVHNPHQTLHFRSHRSGFSPQDAHRVSSRPTPSCRHGYNVFPHRDALGGPHCGLKPLFQNHFSDPRFWDRAPLVDRLRRQLKALYELNQKHGSLLPPANHAFWSAPGRGPQLFTAQRAPASTTQAFAAVHNSAAPLVVWRRLRAGRVWSELGQPLSRPISCCRSSRGRDQGDHRYRSGAE